MAKRETILIADDAQVNRLLLRGLFEKEYTILEVKDGEEALSALHQHSEEIGVLLLDLIMPKRDGYSVMEAMRDSPILSRVPILVITADNRDDSRVRVFELGATDILTKPFSPEVVRSRVRNIIELNRHRRYLEELVSNQAATLRESNAAVVDMLSSLVEYRSLESGQHIRRIRMFTDILLNNVAQSCPEYNLNHRSIQIIINASSLHDIGKIAIPDSILNKPSKLTAEEFNIMQAHTLRGCEILGRMGPTQDREYLYYAYNICRHHHERWDGRGYPDGLRGDNIPICAQVVAIADCYDALTTNRVYKRAIAHQDACQMILTGECGVFSPRLLQCFDTVTEQFAQLSQQYADSAPVPSEAGGAAASPPLWEEDAEDQLDTQQRQDYSLLRYLNATVIKLDPRKNTAGLIYLASPDFGMLPRDATMAATVQAIVGLLHPADRAAMEEFLGAGLCRLLQEGTSRRDLSCHVQNGVTRAYFPYSVTLLRISPNSPRRQELLLIWRRAGAARLNSAPPHLQFGNLLLKRRLDAQLTAVQYYPEYLHQLGYTVEEMELRFQHRQIELVHPADRATLLSEIQRQLSASQYLCLEYRMVTKDGRVIWVLDRCCLSVEDGQEYLYCILLDVSTYRQTEENLRLSLERHNIIMDQTQDVIFEWDIHTDRLTLSSNWEKRLGHDIPLEGVSRFLGDPFFVHHDDLSEFQEFVKAVRSGIPYKEAEVRLLNSAGKHNWYRIRISTQFDADGWPFKAVGILLDIDKQKKASSELMARAERDSLTNLYNKAASHSRIEACLQETPPDSVSAMLLLDVDDFKIINDRYGHLFGDAVLLKLAEQLSALFRSDDIISRVGGDEFLVFMPDLHDAAAARQRASRLIQTFHTVLEQELREPSLSCSVGIAFTDDGGGNTYQSLFDHADRALYRAKGAGKDRFAIFDPSMLDAPFGLENAAPRDSAIDSDAPSSFSLSGLMERIVEVFYETEDFDSAVLSVLELLGRLFRVSRVYIMETLPGGETCRNTYEWCNEEILSQKDILQNLPYLQNGEDYRANFTEDGLFYCQDIQHLPPWQSSLLSIQHIRAMLQCSFYSGTVFEGFIGFDDCTIQRLWSQKQVDALSFLSKLISTFLLKKRAQDIADNANRDLRNLLDHENSWLYLVEPNTMKFLYCNRKFTGLAPDALPGRHCYEVLFRRDAPCAACPVAAAQRSSDHMCSMELYNDILRLWLLADASLLDWEGQPAYLISCRDVSRYKTEPPSA